MSDEPAYRICRRCKHLYTDIQVKQARITLISSKSCINCNSREAVELEAANDELEKEKWKKRM